MPADLTADTIIADLVLTAPSGHVALTPEVAGAVADAFGPAVIASGGRLGDGAGWSAPLAPTLTPAPAPLARLRARLGDAGVDANVVPRVDGQRPGMRLLVADMESTIIEQEMLDELADFVGLRERISDITARAMRGELDFEAALKERVGLLAGLPEGVLDEVATRITIMPGAQALVTSMKAAGGRCMLVSGGFTVFTGRIAERLGFDGHQANVLEVADGRLTGHVRAPILGREAKLAALKRLAAEAGIPLWQTIAVGDGANDLAMLGEAGIGVAFRAKPKVQESALAQPTGAVVTHGDLTALLYLQGLAPTA